MSRTTIYNVDVRFANPNTDKGLGEYRINEMQVLPRIGELLVHPKDKVFLRVVDVEHCLDTKSEYMSGGYEDRITVSIITLYVEKESAKWNVGITNIL